MILLLILLSTVSEAHLNLPYSTIHSLTYEIIFTENKKCIKLFLMQYTFDLFSFSYINSIDFITFAILWVINRFLFLKTIVNNYSFKTWSFILIFNISLNTYYNLNESKYIAVQKSDLELSFVIFIILIWFKPYFLSYPFKQMFIYWVVI